MVILNDAAGVLHNLFNGQSKSLVDLSERSRETIGGQPNGGVRPLSPSVRAGGFDGDHGDAVRKDLRRSQAMGSSED